MTRKRISSLAIIQRVISEFGISNFSYKDEAIEWIGDAIQEVGCYLALVNKLRPVTINNGIIEIPCDLFELNQILYKGKSLNYGRSFNFNSNDAFYNNGDGKIDYKVLEDFIQTSEALDKLRQMAEHPVCDTCPSETERQQIIERIYLRLNNLGKEMIYTKIEQSEHWYANDADGYKFWNTDIKEGTAFVLYKAFPLDEYGYPLVYDDINVIGACKFYVLKCILHRGYKHPTVDIQYAEGMYQSYLRKAYAGSLVMTERELNDFKNKWTDFTYQFRTNDNLFKQPNFLDYGVHESTQRFY